MNGGTAQSHCAQNRTGDYSVHRAGTNRPILPIFGGSPDRDGWSDQGKLPPLRPDYAPSQWNAPDGTLSGDAPRAAECSGWSTTPPLGQPSSARDHQGDGDTAAEIRSERLLDAAHSDWSPEPEPHAGAHGGQGHASYASQRIYGPEYRNRSVAWTRERKDHLHLQLPPLLIAAGHRKRKVRVHHKPHHPPLPRRQRDAPPDMTLTFLLRNAVSKTSGTRRRRYEGDAVPVVFLVIITMAA
ncbi:hypothetical protein K437DRAFT_55707 [Tilletiaria anomala UBC 951]|uniref:Uncharacterized protein n=1 Tax=Tilletiaria anomala (strain ATCC 24038 / CBS 436.72 / UBC 951) TaxID=1037660 RepID=A0A066WL27_TILAU|nr:uncharacterized protein K437DRAFT_55707 [Tilletiaria anomala UBC 951]KDN51320.1 hypothetical protein K437DRAFT_55707 [Tilletiaria anomala UBC 951]